MKTTVIVPLAADYAFPNTMKGQRGQVRAGGAVLGRGALPLTVTVPRGEGEAAVRVTAEGDARLRRIEYR